MNIYRERAHLTRHLASIYTSRISFNDPSEPDWGVLYIDTPEGQLSWHISPDDMYLFIGIPVVNDFMWDGHTTEEKYERLRRLST